MCIFSGRVDGVSDTNIFARASTGNRQYLVYSMQFQAKEDLAMILPLPVSKATGEDDVKFINLERYPKFFEDLRRGFLKPRTSGALSGWGSGALPPPKLKVRTVGIFSASFVPTVKDFDRLDERFRLPEGTWQALPDYQDFGFAVFKLDQNVKQIHPMAFEFPRRNPDQLFFPTVHIHDGQVHTEARFDHSLYCQVDDPNEEQSQELMQWEESSRLTGAFMHLQMHKYLMNLSQHCYRRRIGGQHKNMDFVV